MTTDLNIPYLCNMIHREEEKANYFGTLLFAVLCYLLFLSFSTAFRDSSSYSSPNQLKSEISLSSTRAVVTASIQLPELQSSCQSLRYANHLTLFCKTFRLFAADRTNAQSLSLFEKKELLIKTIFSSKSFCLRIPPSNAEEPPILG